MLTLVKARKTLGKDDFPVDIFKVNDEYDDITRENILFDLLLAGVREFTIPQTNALKNALSHGPMSIK